MHSHTHTCAKGKGSADDAGCRLKFPRPLCDETRVEHTSCVTQRRDHAMLVPYSPALMLAQPCNHALYPFCELSRFQRELQLYQEKAQQPGGTQARPPELPTLQQNAADASEYSTKYATKPDGQEVNTTFFQAALQQADDDKQQQPSSTAASTSAAPAPAASSPALLGRKFLRKAHNRCHAATTYPAPLACLHNLGFGDSVLSHVTAFHPYYAHAQAFREQVKLNELMPDHSQHFQPHRVQHAPQADGSVRLVSPTDDYRHRSAALKHYSPFVLTALFHKVKLTPDIGCVFVRFDADKHVTKCHFS